MRDKDKSKYKTARIYCPSENNHNSRDSWQTAARVVLDESDRIQMVKAKDRSHPHEGRRLELTGLSIAMITVSYALDYLCREGYNTPDLEFPKNRRVSNKLSTAQS